VLPKVDSAREHQYRRQSANAVEVGLGRTPLLSVQSLHLTMDSCVLTLLVSTLQRAAKVALV
jgi:hypothetical protein